MVFEKSIDALNEAIATHQAEHDSIVEQMSRETKPSLLISLNDQVENHLYEMDRARENLNEIKLLNAHATTLEGINNVLN